MFRTNGGRTRDPSWYLFFYSSIRVKRDYFFNESLTWEVVTSQGSLVVFLSFIFLGIEERKSRSDKLHTTVDVRGKFYPCPVSGLCSDRTYTFTMWRTYNVERVSPTKQISDPNLSVRQGVPNTDRDEKTPRCPGYDKLFHHTTGTSGNGVTMYRVPRDEHKWFDVVPTGGRLEVEVKQVQSGRRHSRREDIFGTRWPREGSERKRNVLDPGFPLLVFFRKFRCRVRSQSLSVSFNLLRSLIVDKCYRTLLYCRS